MLHILLWQHVSTSFSLARFCNQIDEIKDNLFKEHNYIKDKEIPVQPWTGPEGCRGLGLPDFKTVDT